MAISLDKKSLEWFWLVSDVDGVGLAKVFVYTGLSQKELEFCAL